MLQHARGKTNSGSASNCTTRAHGARARREQGAGLRPRTQAGSPAKTGKATRRDASKKQAAKHAHERASSKQRGRGRPYAVKRPPTSWAMAETKTSLKTQRPLPTGQGKRRPNALISGESALRAQSGAAKAQAAELTAATKR